MINNMLLYPSNRLNLDSKKYNFKSVYLILLMLFPITTLIQGKIDLINKINVVFVVISVIFMLFDSGIKFKYLFLIFLTLISTVLSFLFLGGDKLINVNMPFYFIMWILNAIMFCNFKSDFFIEMYKVRRWLLAIVIIWHCMILISLPLKSSYSSSGFGSFTSFSGDTFRLCTSTFEIMSMVIPLIIFYGRKYSIFVLLPALTLFLGGSRTYFFIGCVLFVLILKFTIKSNRNFWLIFLTLSFLGTILFFNSSVGNKFIGLMDEGYYGFWETFTSGRSGFWTADLKYYLDKPLLNIILGNGFNFSMDVNKVYVGRPIWSHNDFIECLMCGGFLQLILYFISIHLCFRELKGNKKKIVLFLTMLIWFFDAFFNMFYTYFCTNIGFLILMLFLDHSYLNCEVA